MSQEGGNVIIGEGATERKLLSGQLSQSAQKIDEERGEARGRNRSLLVFEIWIVFQV